MPYGTSVLGDQLVFSGASVGERYVQLHVQPRGLRPSYRVGFYYLAVVSDDQFEDTSVIRTGLVYDPGILLRVPQVLRLAGHKLAFYVSWNFADLTYFWQFRS